MKVWIDLANAPHIAFFLPIVDELKRRGHDVVISIRDFNQTVELAHRNGLAGTVIGKHGGKSSVGKLLNLLGRAGKLTAFGRKKGIDVAVSHNSYTQTIAGRRIGAKVVTLMDYEGQPANHIAFRMAHRVVVPACFPKEALRKFGAKEAKVFPYKGYKEQVYLSSFLPNDAFFPELIRSCNLNQDWDPEHTILVVVRTPASIAAYHHFSNNLFEQLLMRLDSLSGVTVVLLPRTAEQRFYYGKKYPGIRIPAKPLPGNDLVYHSDLVISAGGTMNREAAVLGTPVCTIFAGNLPAVDRTLIALGRLKSLETERDLENLRIEKKRKKEILGNTNLRDEIIDMIVTW
jgi:hypothetical protein